MTAKLRKLHALDCMEIRQKLLEVLHSVERGAVTSLPKKGREALLALQDEVDILISIVIPDGDPNIRYEMDPGYDWCDLDMSLTADCVRLARWAKKISQMVCEYQLTGKNVGRWPSAAEDALRQAASHCSIACKVMQDAGVTELLKGMAN